MPLIALIFALLLSGCAAVSERPAIADPDGAWRARSDALAHVTTWDVRGRLALRSADEGFHASLRWVRAAERHRIDLSGPLGGGHVRLMQDRQGAELRDANDKVYRDVSVQRLLLRHTGWDLPLDGMNYWLLGLPAPGVAMQYELDDWGRLKSLEQLGWEIRFLEYAQLTFTRYGAVELPTRVFVRRKSDAPMERTLELRLVIEEWTQFGDNGNAAR